MDDFWQEDYAKEWVKNVLNNMAPNMADSAVVASIVPSGEYSEGDAKFWVELGASIMMNKPIVALVMPGQEIPDKLRLVADEIVEMDEGMSPEVADRVQAAVERILGPEA